MAKTTESLEMYLENILVLQSSIGNVRSIDIAHKTGYSKPSVSRAVKLLQAEECIEVDANGYITLTEKGRAIASDILDRHKLITDFFLLIGVDEKNASDDACRIEHVISEHTFARLKEFISTYKKSQR